jgi:hypothetical protein
MEVRKIMVARLTLGMTLTAITIAVAACSGGGGGGGGDGEPASSGEAAPASVADRDQVKALFRSLTRRFRDGDGHGYCALLLSSERRKVAVFGRNAGYGRGCAATIEDAAGIASEQGIAADAALDRLAFDGSGRRAIIITRDKGHSPKRIGVVKTADGWRISESGFDPDPLAAAAAAAGGS